MHFWYISRRNPLKRHFKIELENKSCKRVRFFCILALSGTLLDTLWPVFLCVWGVGALKEARFSRVWGPGLPKDGVSLCLVPLALQTYRFSRVGRLGPRRKRPSNTLAPGSGRQAIQKKAHRIDNHLGSATSQTQERKKEANKRITTIGSPHRGGLGAAHSDY